MFMDMPPLPPVPGYERLESGILKPKSSILPGFGGAMVGMAAKADPIITYNGVTNSAANTSSYGFTLRPIGAATADRLVVVVTGCDSDSSIAINTCSINGVSASLAVKTANTYEAVGIFYLNVPSGTTATIAVTTTATATALSVGTYSIYNLDSFTPVGTTQNAGSQNVTLAAASQIKGVAIAGSQAGEWNGWPTCTWGSPMVETYDFGIDDYYYVASSSAYAGDLSTTNLSFSLTRSRMTYGAAVLATWR